MPCGHILCVTSNFPRWPGDSTTPFVLHLSQDLQQLGWKVTVLAPHAPGAKTHEVIDGITVRRFRYLLPESQETVCYQGGALINLRQHPTNYIKLLPLIVCEWLQMMYRLKKEQYDLIHTHWLLPQGFVGVLSSSLLGTPHVCTVHGGDVFSMQSAWLKKFKAITVRRSDAVTVNSSATRQAVNSLCPGYPSLHTIPMGVAVHPPLSLESNLKKEDIRSRFRRGHGPLVLFIGRLVEEKGLADLLDAIAILRQTAPDTTLLIIGEGQDRPLFEGQANNLGLSDAVFFFGWADPDEIPIHLAAADIFVAPSRIAKDGWVEAQGLTIIEAMMAGLPVIATKTGGIIDSVTHQSSGLLVPERSPAELAAALERLINCPNLARRLGENAKQVATDKFSRQTSAEKFSGLFSSIIASRTSGTRGKR